MKSTALPHGCDRSRRNRRRSRYLCLAIVCVLSLVGCVSKSRYEAVATEMNGLRADLLRAQDELRALEEQRHALQKLNADRERLLRAIQAELQQARTAYAEYKAEEHKLDGLRAKARALQSEHTKQMQGIKAAKREELRMQGVVERYEKEMRLAPDIGDVLRISQAGEANSENSRVVASVTPLSSTPSASENASPSKGQPTVAPLSAPQTTTTASTAPPSPSITPPAAVPPAAQPPAASAPSTSTPKRQPVPAEESWIGSVSGWLSTLWGWLFS